MVDTVVNFVVNLNQLLFCILIFLCIKLGGVVIYNCKYCQVNALTVFISIKCFVFEKLSIHSSSEWFNISSAERVGYIQARA
jgi:hypothetical protein